jgi:hypothetical protein
VGGGGWGGAGWEGPRRLAVEHSACPHALPGAGGGPSRALRRAAPQLVAERMERARREAVARAARESERAREAAQHAEAAQAADDGADVDEVCR